MKNLIACLIVLFLVPAAGFCAEDRPLTLQECYKLALKQSELIAVDAELIKQADAHFLEAFGTLLPQVSFSRSDIREHSKISPSSNKGFEQGFAFKQVLFSGFKEFAAMTGSKFERKQRENEKLRAEQLLFVDVSDAFYLLMELQEDLNTLKAIRGAFIDRIKELESRVSLGRSRTSEVVSTETQLYTIEDQIELDKSQVEVARELLEFLTGKPIGEITESEPRFFLKEESVYLSKASMRPDVQAANFAWQLDQKGVVVARSGFFPQLNLETYYFGHRDSAPTDSRWNMLFTVDVPIFEGTTTYGKVKEAVSQARESELLFKRAFRSVASDIHDAYVNARADLLRTAILETAVKSAERNYKLQLEDYKLSVVNNLDVLTAIQSLEDVRRNFIHISYESKRFYWQLLVAAGEISVE